jgi:hypothetical protein
MPQAVEGLHRVLHSKIARLPHAGDKPNHTFLMKMRLKLILLAALFSLPLTAPAVNSDVGAAIVRQFGEAQLRNVVLVTASSNEVDVVLP